MLELAIRTPQTPYGRDSGKASHSSRGHGSIKAKGELGKKVRIRWDGVTENGNEGVSKGKWSTNHVAFGFIPHMDSGNRDGGKRNGEVARINSLWPYGGPRRANSSFNLIRNNIYYLRGAFFGRGAKSGR